MQVIIRRKKVKTRNVATETEQTQSLKQATRPSTDSKPLVGKDPVLDGEKQACDIHENLSTLHGCIQAEMPSTLPPRNPFSSEHNVEDAIDDEYVQSKESLVDNLFAMELSSVISDEDLRPSSNCQTCPSNIMLDNADNTILHDTLPGLMDAHESISDRNEDSLQLEKLENEIDKELKGNVLDPPPLKIKVEPDSEEQPVVNSDTSAGEFSIVDLLPKQDVRKYKCDICHASFKNPSAVERHNMYVHVNDVYTKPRPHGCTICDKKFVEANCLKKHLRTHTGEKPYHCPFCGKAFAQSQNLNKHKYIHTDNRPHKCKVCGDTFRQHSHLARHKLIHTGEKPYQCGQCPKTYRTRSQLMRHLKSSKHKGVIVKSKKT